MSTKRKTKIIDLAKVKYPSEPTMETVNEIETVWSKKKV